MDKANVTWDEIIEGLFRQADMEDVDDERLHVEQQVPQVPDAAEQRIVQNTYALIEQLKAASRNMRGMAQKLLSWFRADPRTDGVLRNDRRYRPETLLERCERALIQAASLLELSMPDSVRQAGPASSKFLIDAKQLDGDYIGQWFLNGQPARNGVVPLRLVLVDALVTGGGFAESDSDRLSERLISGILEPRLAKRLELPGYKISVDEVSGLAITWMPRGIIVHINEVAAPAAGTPEETGAPSNTTTRLFDFLAELAELTEQLLRAKWIESDEDLRNDSTLINIATFNYIVRRLANLFTDEAVTITDKSVADLLVNLLVQRLETATGEKSADEANAGQPIDRLSQIIVKLQQAQQALLLQPN